MILVTGGAGFIGSHLVEALVLKGYQVRVLDNFSTGEWENLKKVASEIHLLEGSITQKQVVQQAVKGVEVIFHLAACVSIAQVLDQVEEAFHTNTTGTLHLLEEARRQKVKLFVFASSCAVYGDRGKILSESELPLPKHPYGVQKLTGEHYLRVYHEIYRLSTLSLRYFNVYGPRQRKKGPYSSVIPNFVTALLQGKAPIIFGDGKQSRDFVYVEDVVRANLLALESPHPFQGEVCNIGTGKATSVLELAHQIAKIVGEEIPPRFGPARAGEMRHAQADLQHAKKLLGYSPKVSLEEGLEKTIRWYREKGA